MDFINEYSFENPVYAPLKPLSAAVSNACLMGNRVGDTIKEKLRCRLHVVHTSDFFHGIAHKCLEYLDEFADILHTANLEQEYPPTDALAEEIDTLDKAFDVFTDALNDIKVALYDFIRATDNVNTKAMSIGAEDILEDVDESFAELITAWNAWKANGSEMSFDKWIAGYMRDKAAGEDD